MSDTQDPIYLDHNATTPVLPEAVDAMIPYLVPIRKCSHREDVQYADMALIRAWNSQVGF